MTPVEREYMIHKAKMNQKTEEAFKRNAEIANNNVMRKT